MTDDPLAEREKIWASRLEAKQGVAAGIAHDINHVLGIIKNMTAFLRRDLPEEATADARVQEDLQDIEDALTSGERLTNALMVFAQEQPTHPSIFNLNDVIGRLAPLLESFPGIQVEYDLASDLWDMKADRGKIEQVIINLAINANEAMKEGGTLSIDTHNEIDIEPGIYVDLVIRDTGPGIPSELRKHIFEPFFTTKPSSPGSHGLGLATVSGIVDQAKGEIIIEPDDGCGARFKIRLPVGHQKRPHRQP